MWVLEISEFGGKAWSGSEGERETFAWSEKKIRKIGEGGRYLVWKWERAGEGLLYTYRETESLLVNSQWVYRLDVWRCLRPDQGRTRFYYDLLLYFYGHNNVLSFFLPQKKKNIYIYIYYVLSQKQNLCINGRCCSISSYFKI